MKYALIVLIQTYLIAGISINQEAFKMGRRGDKYRVWVYFNDKKGSKTIDLNQKVQHRRLKNNVAEELFWYDLKVSESYIHHISSIGVEIINQSRWLNAVSVLVSMAELEWLSNLNFVKKIEAVKGFNRDVVHLGPEVRPNSREFDYGEARSQIEQINAHILHDQGYTGLGVRILLMDTGFDLSHNSLSHINVISQWDVINDDNQTADENEAENDINQDSHGTMVLSTIASFAPNEFMGVAYDAEFLLAKTEDVTQEIPQEEDNYVVALEWGEISGADIVSTSLGYLDWYNYEDMDGNTAVTTIAVDIASSLGMLCITAAGNSGDDNWYYIISPADADSVISVGAVSAENQIADFSSHGPSYDGRIKPEVCARGLYTWCISANSTTSYTRKSGTSLSCPLVAGAAALIMQARPSLTAMQVRDAIINTATMANNPDNTYGYGIMNTSSAKDYQFNLTNDYEEIRPSNFKLTSLYPNPFNSSLAMKVRLESAGYLKIDILTLNGSIVSCLFDDFLVEADVFVRWEPDNISSGTYLVNTNFEGQNIIKKVTYIK